MITDEMVDAAVEAYWETYEVGTTRDAVRRILKAAEAVRQKSLWTKAIEAVRPKPGAPMPDYITPAMERIGF